MGRFCAHVVSLVWMEMCYVDSMGDELPILQNLYMSLKFLSTKDAPP